MRKKGCWRKKGFRREKGGKGEECGTYTDLEEGERKMKARN